MLGVALTVWHYILKVSDKIGHCRFVNFDLLVPKVPGPLDQSPLSASQLLLSLYERTFHFGGVTTKNGFPTLGRTKLLLLVDFKRAERPQSFEIVSEQGFCLGLG